MTKFNFGDIKEKGFIVDQNTNEKLAKFYFPKYSVEIISKSLENAKVRIKEMFGGELHEK